MKKLLLLAVLAAFCLPTITFAQDPAATSTATEQVPAVAPTTPPALVQPDDTATMDQVLDATVSLVQNGKSMGKLALAVAMVNLLIMLMKTSMMGNLFTKLNPIVKRLVILALGQAAGILMAMEAGTGPLAAVIGGLLSSGGAVAIFEMAQPLWAKATASTTPPPPAAPAS